VEDDGDPDGWRDEVEPEVELALDPSLILQPEKRRRRGGVARHQRATGRPAAPAPVARAMVSPSGRRPRRPRARRTTSRGKPTALLLKQVEIAMRVGDVVEEHRLRAALRQRGVEVGFPPSRDSGVE
jgi:hypothetical protein